MSFVSDDPYYLDPDLYDAIYSDVVADIEPHVALMREAGGPALELCCGNGRLLIPTLEAGIACDGMDLAPRMLEDLRAKLAARNLHANVMLGDMRDFSLPHRYELIVIGFNSFLHNLTQADQLATLRCCRHHLAPEGRLVIVAFHPSAEKLIEWAGPERLFKDLPWRDGRVRVYDHADDDRIEQVRHMTRRIEFADATGQVTRQQQVEFSLRYVYKPEMELLLRVAGFSGWEVRASSASFMDPASVAHGRPMREGDNLQWTAWRE